MSFLYLCTVEQEEHEVGDFERLNKRLSFRFIRDGCLSSPLTSKHHFIDEPLPCNASPSGFSSSSTALSACLTEMNGHVYCHITLKAVYLWVGG